MPAPDELLDVLLTARRLNQTLMGMPAWHESLDLAGAGMKMAERRGSAQSAVGPTGLDSWLRRRQRHWSDTGRPALEAIDRAVFNRVCAGSDAARLRAASHHARAFTPEDLRDLRVTWRTIEAGLHRVRSGLCGGGLRLGLLGNRRRDRAKRFEVA
jgi:hypothetical protein